jgi:oligopeptide transport system substrate-binding protein
MRRSHRTILGATISLSLIVGACTGSAPSPSSAPIADATLTTALTGNATFLYLDPAKTLSASVIEQILMVYEPLLGFDPITLRPVAAAARDLPTISADGLRYRLTLRDGLLFSDRVPVRAHDFAYGIARFCDPEISSPYGATVHAIRGCAEWAAMDSKAAPDVLAVGRRQLMSEGIRVLSDRELEIVLREPASHFSAILGLFIAIPIREQDVQRGGMNWWSDPATFVGNGSFVLQEFTPGERIVFVRNERARVPAKLRQWTKLLIEDADKALEMYRSGALDLLAVQGPELATAAKDAALRSDLRVVESGTTAYLKVNHARAPFDDAKVRLAFAKSVDRDAYVKDVRPLSRVATSFIPPGVPGHDADDNAQRFDPQAAKELLAASRYAGALTMPIVWTHRVDRPAAGTIANWFAEQWKRNLGVVITVRAVTLTQSQADLRSLETTPHLEHNAWIMDYPHQHNWLSQFFGLEGELALYRGYANREVGGLLRSADREIDQQTRDALYLRAARSISGEAGMIWLAYTPSALLVRPRVGGLYQSSFDPGGALRPGEVFVTTQ